MKSRHEAARLHRRLLDLDGEVGGARLLASAGLAAEPLSGGLRCCRDKRCQEQRYCGLQPKLHGDVAEAQSLIRAALGGVVATSACESGCSRAAWQLDCVRAS